MIRRDGYITETSLAFGEMIIDIIDRHTNLSALDSYFHSYRTVGQKLEESKSGSKYYHECTQAVLHISSSNEIPIEPGFFGGSTIMNREYGWYGLIEMFHEPMPVIGYPYGCIKEHKGQPTLSIEATYMAPFIIQGKNNIEPHPFSRAEAIMAMMWGNWFEPGSHTLRRIRDQYPRVAEKIQQIVPLYIKAEPAA